MYSNVPSAVNTICTPRSLPSRLSRSALSIYILLVGLVTLALLALLAALCFARKWFIDQLLSNYETYLRSPKLLANEKDLPAIRDS